MLEDINPIVHRDVGIRPSARTGYEYVARHLIHINDAKHVLVLLSTWNFFKKESRRGELECRDGIDVEFGSFFEAGGQDQVHDLWSEFAPSSEFFVEAFGLFIDETTSDIVEDIILRQDGAYDIACDLACHKVLVEIVANDLMLPATSGEFPIFLLAGDTAVLGSLALRAALEGSSGFGDLPTTEAEGTCFQ